MYIDGRPVYGLNPQQNLNPLNTEVEFSPPDEDAITRWKAASPTKQGAIDWACSRITHVSFPIFESVLVETAAEVTPLLPHSVVLFEPEKSSEWACRIVTERYRLASPYAYLRLGEKKAENLGCTLDTLPDDFDKRCLNSVVIVEDASYTGLQMSENVFHADTLLKSREFTPTFHIVIPYASSAALNMLQDLQQNGVALEIHTRIKMPTVAEMVQESSFEDRVPLFRLLWPQHRNPDYLAKMAAGTPMTCFDHKTPNHVSFPPGLVKHHVVKEVHSPYKPKPTTEGSSSVDTSTLTSVLSTDSSCNL